MLWVVIALMTGAGVLCVVWPLSKPRSTTWVPHAGDLNFYRDQLRAIEQDIGTGLVAPGDAAGSRAEIARRLIAAAEHPNSVEAVTGRRWRLLAAAAAIMVLVPALSLGLYLRVGNPASRDMPLASRAALPQDNQLASAIAKVEGHLASHPEDGRGFALLAPLYLRLGRFADAAHAYDEALRLLGETAERRSAYAQSLMLQADGVVTAEARTSFEAALKDDPTQPQPQFFLGLAAMQDGDKERARTLWTTLIASAPAGAPWLPMVKERIATLDVPSASSGPTSPQGAAIAALPAGEQQQMIRGMVNGLAAKLAQDGQNKDGWLRLVRAYAVLGEKARALDALGDARKSLAADPQAISQLDGLAHELGLES